MWRLPGPSPFTMSQMERAWKAWLAICCLSLAVFGQCGSRTPAPLVASASGSAGREAFVRLAGGKGAHVVFVPTAASELRSESGVIWNPDDAGPAAAAFLAEIKKEFGLETVTVLHTRSREIADTAGFVEPLKKADAIWFSSGNAGRLAGTYRGTRFQTEMNALHARGGAIGGESAGAIIQGALILRGRPDKPVLLAKDQLYGFGLVPGVAINPHLTAEKRFAELVTVIDQYPDHLGIGIDDGSAVVICGSELTVIGTGRVAIYDNQKHGGVWYQWLSTGARYNLEKRQLVAEAAPASD